MATARGDLDHRTVVKVIARGFVFIWDKDESSLTIKRGYRQIVLWKTGSTEQATDKVIIDFCFSRACESGAPPECEYSKYNSCFVLIKDIQSSDFSVAMFDIHSVSLYVHGTIRPLAANIARYYDTSKVMTRDNVVYISCKGISSGTSMVIAMDRFIWLPRKVYAVDDPTNQFIDRLLCVHGHIVIAVGCCATTTPHLLRTATEEQGVYSPAVYLFPVGTRNLSFSCGRFRFLDDNDIEMELVPTGLL